MMKFNITFLLCILFAFSIQAQVKYEREHRIKKSQFPDEALSLIDSKLEGAKRLKFYKEIDSLKISYEAKFKKKKLWYSIEFSEEGKLEDIEITINVVDIPNETYQTITNYMKENFRSYSVKKIQQQYVTNGDDDKTLKDAFQNLLISSLNYEIMITGKKENSYQEFEILFDAEGNYKSIRESLPPNYDHVLY